MGHLKHFDEVLKYVNELSGTMDLANTLVRAEGLFRRFERTVEALDRKSHFPAPTGGAGARQRRVGDVGGDKISDTASSSPARIQAAGSSTATDARARARPASTTTPEHAAADREHVISPELRALLSRRVVVLDEDEAVVEPPAHAPASGSGSGSRP